MALTEQIYLSNVRSEPQFKCTKDLIVADKYIYLNTCN